MLHSVLLHLSGVQHGEPVIDFGVNLARRCEARVRGLTLVDTRRLMSLAATCEAAAYANGEFRRLHRVEQEHGAMRSNLSQACLSAGVNFDVRRMRGNPFDVLPPESQFHDLFVTALPSPGSSGDDEDDAGLSARELVDLLFQGVQPMLVVRDRQQPLARVLLVSDGTPATSKAIRSFLQQELLPHAEYRLLAIGDTEDQARESLREIVEYCRSRRMSVETGILRGAMRRVLIPYAQKWQADLVVLGVTRGNAVLRRLIGETAQDILCKTSFALYATA
jgi:nucleotide-binding universal stress UspA family protein